MNQFFRQATPYALEHYGDIASVLGLVVTFVGFAATLRKVKEAQKSAEEARKAAKQAVLRISAHILLEDVNSLLGIISQLNSAYRNNEWAFAIYLSEQVKIRIASLKGSSELSDVERQPIIKANDDFRLLTPQLHKLHKGEELKTFESRFLNSTM